MAGLLPGARSQWHHASLKLTASLAGGPKYPA
jgi:hypothetical protein